MGHQMLSRVVWRRHFAALAFGCAIFAGAVLPAPPVHAQGVQATETQSRMVHKVKVTLAKSRTFRIDKPFATAVIAAPEIADVLPMSDHSIYIQGKKIGTTNISVFDSSMRLVGILDIDVTPDTTTLRENIGASTSSGGIHVSSAGGQVVLSGEARDAVAADRAVSVAKGLAKDTPVINAMKVARSQQVMLKVQFLEVSRNAGEQLGVNWYAGKNGSGVNTGIGAPVTGTTSGGIPIFQSLGALAGASTGSPFGVAIANLVNSGTTVDLMLSALETKGLVRKLAEPNLVALSGDTASFLAGGEFPVPVLQNAGAGTNSITVLFKRFGVELTFMPTVLAHGIINLRLTPSVSELDFTQGVQISGFNIPALTKREANTTIELRDGQSFAIAGLLQATNKGDISQLPWIGSVPVLGALFRSTGYQKNETDLVIIVTPHLVQPGAPGDRLASPLDSRLPGNDVDKFLMGQLERKKEYADYVTSGGGVNGPYGHIIQIEHGANGPVYKR